MRQAKILLFLGLWIAVLPYLGFPFLWKNILISISGVLLAYTEYLNYRNEKIRLGEKNNFDNFSENKI